MYPHNHLTASPAGPPDLAFGGGELWRRRASMLGHPSKSRQPIWGQNLARTPLAADSTCRAVWPLPLGKAWMWRLGVSSFPTGECPYGTRSMKVACPTHAWPGTTASPVPCSKSCSIQRPSGSVCTGFGPNWLKLFLLPFPCRNQRRCVNHWTFLIGTSDLEWRLPQLRQEPRAWEAGESRKSRCGCPCRCRATSCSPPSSSQCLGLWSRTVHCWSKLKRGKETNS